MSTFSMSHQAHMQKARATLAASPPPPEEIEPRVEALVTELIGRVADKWTMVILEVLAEQGKMRFTRLGELVEGVSQKMLTKLEYSPDLAT